MRRRLRPTVEKLSWGRQNWFACGRPSIALPARRDPLDMSFMSKFLVEGRDAGRVLNHISANDIDGKPGGSPTRNAQREGHARRPI